jgi:hypothetical protein
MINKKFGYLFFKRSAFVITETELKLMAAAAIIGLRRIPKNGNRIPAATGMIVMINNVINMTYNFNPKSSI